MYVSAETLTIVISAAGLMLTSVASMITGFAWIVRRMDGMEHRLVERMDAGDTKLSDRIDAVEVKLSDHIDAVDMKLSTRIDALDDKLSARIDAVAADVTDLKVAVARLEGPVRHLIVSAR